MSGKNPAPVTERIAHRFASALYIGFPLPLHFNIVAAACYRERGRLQLVQDFFPFDRAWEGGNFAPILKWKGRGEVKNH